MKPSDSWPPPQPIDPEPGLTDEQLVRLMWKATGEDWDESEVWRLRVFVQYCTGIDI